MKSVNTFLFIIILIVSKFSLSDFLFGQTSVFINTTKDCYTWSLQPNTNQNGNYLVVENNSANNSYAPSLVFFNLSSIPQNAIILEAYLLLYRFTDLGNIIVRIGRLENASWTETGVTYNNMPYGETPPPFKYYNLGSPNTYGAYDVTEFVQAWYSGGFNNNGFQIFTETNGTGAIFYARESGSSYIPKLNVVYQIPIPNPPILVSPPNGSMNIPINPVLDWNPSSGAESYRCQVSTSPSFTNTVFDQSGITGTSVQVGGLQNGTTYYWRVNATNGGGTSNYSNTWNFTTIISPPGQFTLISPPNGSINISTDVTFAWNPSTGATSYTLEYGIPPDVTTVSGITQTQYQVFGLEHNSTYHWGVVAFNEVGNTSSAEWSFTTIPAQPQPPILVSPPNGSTGVSINPLLSWNPSSGADSYRCQVSTSPTFTNTVFDQSGITATSIQVNNLQNGITYYWHVNATNVGGTSNYSDTWNFTIENTSSVEYLSNEIPDDYMLLQNYPNPFNPNTKFEFALPKETMVKLKIYDISGQEVANLVNYKNLSAGYYRYEFNAENLPSGIYLYMLKTEGFIQTRKMILLK